MAGTLNSERDYSFYRALSSSCIPFSSFIFEAAHNPPAGGSPVVIPHYPGNTGRRAAEFCVKSAQHALHRILHSHHVPSRPDSCPDVRDAVFGDSFSFMKPTWGFQENYREEVGIEVQSSWVLECGLRGMISESLKLSVNV